MKQQESITVEKLKELKSNVANLDTFMSNCIVWNENSPNVSNAKQLTKKLKTYRRTIRRVINVVDQKPAIAFFGASQSGKSHLVKNLLQDETEKKFYINDRSSNKAIDYLKHINPEGNGNESTALVTRFVKHNSVHYINEKPIKAELLTVKDLILCICDGFYSVGKVDKIDFDFALKIQESIGKMVPSESNESSVLNEDDIYFIKEYLEKYKKGRASLLLSYLDSTKYWDNLASVIERISYTNFIHIFSVFWYQQPQFNQLFSKLLSSLSLLCFSKFIYCDFDIITRSLPEQYKDKFSSTVNILDVRALENILNETDSFSVDIESGQSISLSSDMLCALCKEIILELPEPKDHAVQFIDDLDILDFPGSRPGVPISLDERVTNKDLGQALLRGKVNFLFNTYSDDFKLNNLAIVSCLAEQKDGSAQIPELLNNWIINYIGDTPEEREDSIKNMGLPPLFVILTFWNKILSYDDNRDNIDPKERLDTAFKTRFYQDIFSNNSWHNDWLSHQNFFQNIYLLRDFNYCTLFKKDDDNFENGINDSQLEFYNNVKNYFLKLNEASVYFKDSQESWNAATTENLDGSDLIIKNLFHVTSNKHKTRRLIGIVNKAYTSFINNMPKPKLEDVTSLIRDAKRKSIDISTRLGMYVEEGASLGAFQELFTLNEEEVYEIILVLIKSHKILTAGQLKKYFAFLLQHPELRQDISKDEKLEILMNKMGYDSISELTKVLEVDYKFNLNKLFDKNLEKLKRKSTFIAEEIKSYWVERILNIEGSVTMSESLTDETIVTIGNSLRNNFDRINMVDHIASSISSYVDEAELSDEAYFMISNIINGIINNFVMSAGWDYTDAFDQERIRQVSEQNMVNILDVATSKRSNVERIDPAVIEGVFDDLENEVNLINESLDKGTSHTIIGKFSSLYNLTRWQDCLKLSFMANLSSVDYNIESNNRLKEILKERENIKIAL